MVGEHIRTRRDGHWTHGIDCGDQTVIHLAQDGRVLRSYRPEFLSRAEAVEVVTHRERTYPAKEIVARAYSRIADPALAAMFPDSRAFAEWCATGRLPASTPNLAVGVPGATPLDGAPARAAAPRPAGPVTARAPRAQRARPAQPGTKAARAAAKPRAAAKRSGKAARKGPARKKASPARAKAPARGPKAKRGRR